MDKVDLPEIIQICLEKGIQVTFEKRNDEIVCTLPGFYKSDVAELILGDDDVWKCRTRYGREVDVRSFEDLVAENAYWWALTCERMDRDVEPNAAWKPHLEAQGRVDKVEVVRPRA